jgi:hypothetical protein
MEKHFAVLEDSLVINTIICDSLATAKTVIGHDNIIEFEQSPNGPAINWTWDGTQFVDFNVDVRTPPEISGTLDDGTPIIV